MSKRKLDETPVTEAQAAALERLDELQLPVGFACLAPLLDGIRQAYEKTTPRPKIPTRQATDFRSTRIAAKALGIDYKESIEYIYKLKETTHNNVKELSPHFDAVIKDLKTSDYVGTQYDESLSRTILDLLVDRLQHLEDKDAFRQLLLSAEVPVSVKIHGIDGKPELIRGRADWALGYGRDKAHTGSILIVVEAKPCESASIGLPQMLVYMAAVQEARLGHTNKDVFGMLSDSHEFKFAFLDSNKKFYVSRPLLWYLDQQEIISYVDAMLLDAIQSSLHTTPTEIQHKTLLRYRKYLESKWVFGEDAEDKAETDAEMDEGVFVDVVNVDGCIVLRTTKRLSM